MLLSKDIGRERNQWQHNATRTLARDCAGYHRRVSVQYSALVDELTPCRPWVHILSNLAWAYRFIAQVSVQKLHCDVSLSPNLQWQCGQPKFRRRAKKTVQQIGSLNSACDRDPGHTQTWKCTYTGKRDMERPL